MVRQVIRKQGIQRRQGPTLQFKIQTLWQRKITKQMGWTIRRTLGFTHGSGDNHGCERRPICGERTVTKGILGARRCALHYIDIYTMDEEPEHQA